jgi:hypothetical protein
MAQSIRDIVCSINDVLEGTFKNARFYGIAISTEKEGKAQPQANEQPVSFDDSYGMQVYHKAGNVAVSYASGYGDNQNTINTFSMSMLVFNNSKITGLATDEIAMIIQALLANINNSATIFVANFILNTQSIFAAEYRGHSFSLPEYAGLMQINYTVEIIFKSGCFDLCPGDFSQCKNN